MAPSGPCGSDRLGRSLTSFTSTPAPWGHAISEPKRGRAFQTGTSLAAQNCPPDGLKAGSGRLCAAASGERRAAGFAQAACSVREGPDGKDHTDHQQQELLVMVAARLAAG